MLLVARGFFARMPARSKTRSASPKLDLIELQIAAYVRVGRRYDARSRLVHSIAAIARKRRGPSSNCITQQAAPPWPQG